MFIDKFKMKDGSYNKDNCSYEYADQLLGNMLGFCGCGNPDEALGYVREALQLIDNRKQLVWKDKMTYEQWAADVDKLFPVVGSDYFMWYFLDHKGFTEHGSSVPGWLTTKGEELLADLNELITE
jgi:hypothetical protein